MDTNIQLTNGMAVRGSDGDKAGKIVEVSPSYVVGEKEAETRNERVGSTVRREEVRIDDQTIDAADDRTTRR